jgi:hypothetical protein
MAYLENPLPAAPQILRFMGNVVDGASYFRNRLTYGYTRVSKFVLQNDQQGVNGFDYITLYNYAGSLIPDIGTVDANYPYVRPPVATKITYQPTDTDKGGAPTGLTVRIDYEGSTGHKLWTWDGGCQQEAWSYDNAGNPILVGYMDPTNPKNMLLPGPGGIKLAMPRVAQAVRFTPLINISFTFYTTDFAESQAYLGLEGMVNSVTWDLGQQAKISYSPRTCLCMRVVVHSDNGGLWRVQGLIVYKNMGWDQLQLFLSMNGKMLPGTDPIPQPQPAGAPSNPKYWQWSYTGLQTPDDIPVLSTGPNGSNYYINQNTTTRLAGHRGWTRARVQNEFNFNFMKPLDDNAYHET